MKDYNIAADGVIFFERVPRTWWHPNITFSVKILGVSYGFDFTRPSSLLCHPTPTVEELKKRIQYSFDIPTQEQILTFGNQGVLLDNAPLPIGTEATLTMRRGWDSLATSPKQPSKLLNSLLIQEKNKRMQPPSQEKSFLDKHKGAMVSLLVGCILGGWAHALYVKSTKRSRPRQRQKRISNLRPASRRR